MREQSSAVVMLSGRKFFFSCAIACRRYFIYRKVCSSFDIAAGSRGLRDNSGIILLRLFSLSNS